MCNLILGLSVFLLSLRPKKSGERALGNDSPTTEPFEQISSLYGEKIKIIIYQDVLCFHIQMIEMERSSALRTWGLVSDSQNIKEHEHA